MNQPKKTGNPFINSQLLKQCRTMAVIALILGVLAIGLGLSVHHALKRAGLSSFSGSSQEALTKQIQAQQTQFEQFEADIASRLNHLRPGVEHRLLSQAIYLVHLADLQLELNRDPSAAIHLLNTAQKRIKQLHDPALIPLNRALSKDIVKLNQFATYSPVQTVLALDAIYQKLEHLPFQRMSMPKPLPALAKQRSEYKKLPWYRKVWSNLGGLERFMIIRHDTNGYAPLLSVQQKALLRDDIRAKLLQTEWAVLHHEPKLYQQNLNQVTQWVQHYFQPSHKRAALLNDIKVLHKINVNPDLHSIEKSLVAVHKAISASWETMFSDQPKPRSAPTDKSKSKPEHAL